MTTLKEYPYFSGETLPEIAIQLRYITNIRKDDITQINNIGNSFISGRRVGKIPSSSTDVNANTDLVGDFNVTTAFAYFLVNNAGTAEWRRVAVASF